MIEVCIPENRQQRKSLNDLFDAIPLQNVNSTPLRKSEEKEIDWLISGLFSKRRASQIAEVCLMNLFENVDLHDDTPFLKSRDMANFAYLYVWEISDKIGEFVDSGVTPYLYTGGKLKALLENRVYRFNASKEHALFTNNTCKIVTFWFSRV